MKEQTKLTISETAEYARAYNKLLSLSADIRRPDDEQTIRRLLQEATDEIDIFQRKAPKFPLITHAIEVANILIDDVGLSRGAAICAIFADMVQQSPTLRAKVAETFGEPISTICEGLVKVAELYERHTSVENENFRKLLFTFAQDVRVIFVILADRLNVMRHLKLYPKADQLRIGSEVAYLYAPLAHRMGLYGMKSELEDLAMKFTNREVYDSIARKLNETKRSRDSYISTFIAPLKKALTEQGFKFDIKGRTKTISSIYNKLRKSNVDFEHIYDLFAIRIIIDCDLKDEKAECWRAYSLVTDMYRPNPARLKDWISVPKGNGYESLHITVFGPDNRWVEVQIRTRRMDEVAEKGFAAHWKYKGITTEQNMELWLANIREVLENPELSGVDFIDDFKLNLYDKEVFAFTPKGDLRRLAKGATVLDFAFDVHTNIGRHCVGAIVNDRNVPIKYVIQNGDQVEILTSSRQEPKADWINIVTTSRAKSKLRQALKEQLYRQSDTGRELLTRRLKNWKLELNDTLLHQLMKVFGYKDIHVFLSDVATEVVDIEKIKEYIDNQEQKEEEAEPVKTQSAEKYYTVRPDDRNVLMLDKGLTNIDFTLAKCCNPIFGDPVFAFVSAMGGVKVHRMGCPNEAEMRKRFGYRILEARWLGTEGDLVPVTLRITGNDDLGLLSNISQVLSKDMDAKVRSINVNSTEGGFSGDITILVSSTDTLSKTIKKIKTIKGVFTVTRLEK
ncbi:MAG: bifunctional (p)ppGpp synthetase/guanosine-3',5'-bis(diphosphate) 3'-pyrophosphohydrolase [Bacteroidales bacterium]|nr:bifunctional (p)ppGpp synthetase/guanosine-3',5'-bis(diphosphate) 3'-pyrophosphohydrolase [Bacteroidales bacterium]